MTQIIENPQGGRQSIESSKRHLAGAKAEETSSLLPIWRQACMHMLPSPAGTIGVATRFYPRARLACEAHVACRLT